MITVTEECKWHHTRGASGEWVDVLLAAGTNEHLLNEELGCVGVPLGAPGWQFNWFENLPQFCHKFAQNDKQAPQNGTWDIVMIRCIQCQQVENSTVWRCMHRIKTIFGALLCGDWSMIISELDSSYIWSAPRAWKVAGLMMTMSMLKQASSKLWLSSKL